MKTVTPPTTSRRPAIDLARVGALVLVVFGHLSLAVVDRGPDGAIRGTNVLSLRPGLAWFAVLAPMPVFFAAAGWANATATVQSATRRLRALIGVATVVVVAWSTASAIALILVDSGGIVSDGARLATQPMWFLAAYVPFTSLGARLARLAARPVVTLGACLLVLAASDVARFALGLPNAIGWPGFFAAWGVPWLLGAWWRGRSERGYMSERKVGAVLAGASIVAAVALVRFAGYSPALIDAVKGARSNTTPPTLFTATAGIAQVGLLMVGAGGLDRVASRWRSSLDRLGAAAVGIYAWHLTALCLCVALLAAGVWAPLRFSVAWWLVRPIWFAAVLTLTGVLTAITALVRPRLERQEAGVDNIHRVRLGLVSGTAGAALIGLVGPRTLPSAAAAIALFIVSWWCLATCAATSTVQ